MQLVSIVYPHPQLYNAYQRVSIMELITFPVTIMVRELVDGAI